ncbi:hypothetical protein ACNOYE_17090 [Nannocystaceae bacterium ST9]
MVAAEKEYMGGKKARMWTYLILAGVLLIGLIIANFAWENPEQAKTALDGFVGLPGWAIAGIAAAIGAGVFALGLKIEADWPEALGALMIAGAVMAGEVMIGLDSFSPGGLTVLPYVIPLLVFVVLFGVGMVKSK